MLCRACTSTSQCHGHRINCVLCHPTKSKTLSVPQLPYTTLDRQTSHTLHLRLNKEKMVFEPLPPKALYIDTQRAAVKHPHMDITTMLHSHERCQIRQGAKQQPTWLNAGRPSCTLSAAVISSSPVLICIPMPMPDEYRNRTRLQRCSILAAATAATHPAQAHFPVLPVLICLFAERHLAAWVLLPRS
jgi:hypothetical protein